jgi:hypothetical protein
VFAKRRCIVRKYSCVCIATLHRKEVQLCLHSDAAPCKDYFPQLALKAEGGPVHLTRERERERESVRAQAASVPSVCVEVELVSVGGRR